jgi:hypothetical protein
MCWVFSRCDLIGGPTLIVGVDDVEESLRPGEGQGHFENDGVEEMKESAAAAAACPLEGRARGHEQMRAVSGP